jgi:predicted nucleic acid-binding protein
VIVRARERRGPAARAARRFVLDTSAVLAFRGDERGADRVETLLRAAEAGRTTIFLSFMTRMEVLYRVMADEGGDAAAGALRVLDATPCRWVSCDPDILLDAARLKAGGGLSVADAWIAATALRQRAILVHKDPEFERLTEVLQERLPR